MLRLRDKWNQLIYHDGIIKTGDVKHVYKRSGEPMKGRYEGMRVVLVGNTVWTPSDSVDKLLMEG